MVNNIEHIVGDLMSKEPTVEDFPTFLQEWGGIIKSVIEEHKHTAELLRERQNLVEAIIDNAPIGITVFNEDGLCTIINKKGADITGTTQEEFQGKYNWHDSPTWTESDYGQVIEEVMRTGKTIERDVRLTNIYGKELWLKAVVGRVSVSGKPHTLLMYDDLTKETNLDRTLILKDRISHAFLTLPNDKVYGAVLDIMLEITESKLGLFGYFCHETESFVWPSMTREAWWDECNVGGKTHIFPLHKVGSIFKRAFEEQKTVVARGGLNTPPGHVPICQVIVSPVVFRGDVIGMLAVADKETAYSDYDIGLIENITSYISPILRAKIDRAKIEEGFERLSKQLQEMNESKTNPDNN